MPSGLLLSKTSSLPGIPAPLFFAHAVCIGVNTFNWVIEPTAFLWEEALIPVGPFAGASVVSNTSITLGSLLLCGSLFPILTETADHWISLVSLKDEITFSG